LEKVYFHGAGAVEYQVRLPRSLKAENIAGCRLLVEASAKADKERLNWPAKTKPGDCPQTDGFKWPTDLTATINGISINASIDSEFADARGVLSHAAEYHHGSCGQLLNLEISGEQLAAFLNSMTTKRTITIRFEVPENAKNKGGLALYGNNTGAWPSDPTLVFDLKPGAQKPKTKQN
jgi:predicted transcriptional regulator